MLFSHVIPVRIIVPWYNSNQKDLAMCFMQQGVKFTEVWRVWHIAVFY